MLTSSNRYFYPLLAFCSIVVSLTFAGYCNFRLTRIHNESLKKIELRVNELEKSISLRALNELKNESTSSPEGSQIDGPVKSLTFRIGTADDRLRIYWANNSITNLPCTSEQGTWACG
uniref:ABC transporter n=1 Tax=Paulinella chromatophora TaxID=39717 RepID=A1XYT6_PAUCH|nr:hypothetical protein PCC_0685 [Paulinella chromatophora]ABH09260.1 ABC transporter [Paulinella chromatophora]ACB43103.1 hypothetical protein PCC_0685 [Paulinella chromatophora]